MNVITTNFRRQISLEIVLFFGIELTESPLLNWPKSFYPIC